MKFKNTYLLLFVFLLLNSFCFGFSNQNPKTDSISSYVEKRQYEKALNYANTNLAISFKNKKYQDYFDIITAKANIYFKLKDNDKTFQVLFDALHIAEKQQLIHYRIVILREIAKKYSLLVNIAKTRKYISIGRKLAMANKDEYLTHDFNQLSYKINNDEAIPNPDSCLYYLKKLERYSRKLNTANQLYLIQNNYFAYYTLINKPDLAKKYLDSALIYATKNKHKEYLATVYSNLAYYYLIVEKDYKKGEQEYLKQLQLYPNDSTSSEVLSTYYNITYAYEKLNDYKKANMYLNKYIDGTSAKYSEKTNADIKDLETKYRIERVESEYKTKQQLLEAKQSKNKKMFFVFIALLILCVILFYFYFQNTKLKQKNKLQDLESQVQQNIINATIDGQENERKKIASVLHDNISALLSSAGLQLSAFVATHQPPSEEIIKTRTILKEAHDKVRDLSHELLPTLLAKFGLFYALQDLCEKNSNSLIQFEYISKVPQRTHFHEDYEMKIYFIITELLNNILKHSQATKSIVMVEVISNRLLLTIEDNGIGFDAKSKSLDGFGLTQIRARIASMNGNLNINSKPETGTIITIKVPVPNTN